MFHECIVHIGAEKTGSTAIQNTLSSGREALLASGWLYPKTLGLWGPQFVWVMLCLDEAWLRGGDLAGALGIELESDWRCWQDRMLAALEEEIGAGCGADRMIVSSEHFHSRLGRWCLRFQIVVYLRRQDRMAVSWYSTMIKEIGDDQCAPFEVGYPSFLELYKNWAAVFGKNAMEVRVYEEAQRGEGWVVGDFLEICGLGCEVVPIERARRANPSLNRLGLDFLRAVRAIGGEEIWRGWGKEAVRFAETRWCGKAPLVTQEEAIRAVALQDHLALELIEKGYEQAERFSMARYAERLREGYGLVMGADGWGRIRN